MQNWESDPGTCTCWTGPLPLTTELHTSLHKLILIQKELYRFQGVNNTTTWKTLLDIGKVYYFWYY